MRIPSPRDCGLPEKFDSWRPNQEQALHQLLTGTTRGEALGLPTGSGKTAIAVAFAKLTKKPTCYVTDSRGLQDQAMGDFQSVGMVDLRGRNNYACDLRPGLSCQEGYAARCPYRGSVHCASSAAEMRAATSPLVITNYAKWTSARKFGTGMSHFEQVIFDEGHTAPKALEAAMQVVLHHKEIEQTLKLNFLDRALCGDVQNWKPWAAGARQVADREMKRAYHQVQTTSDPQSKHVRHYTHMKHLARRLATISLCRAKDWVVDEVEQGYQFDPIRAGRYAESTLLLKVPKIIVMSATLRPKTMYMMGMSKDSFRFTEFDSDFDPRRCPIYWVPTMRVDSRATSLVPLWNRLDQIAARRRDRRGIVHSISHARRGDVLDASRFSDSMIFNQRGEPAGPAVEVYRRAGDGAILVSPSVGAGYDFAGAACEWQFVCKIPFPDSRSKIMKARQEDDREYGPFSAMQSLVQTFGRGMRFRADQCENFLADDHIEWFLPKFGHLAPKSFHAWFRKASVLPQPPPRLEFRGSTDQGTSM